MALSIKDWARQQKARGATAKGNAFEESCAAFLRARGYICDVTKLNRRRTKYGWQTIKGDFFGCLDIIAIPTFPLWPSFIQCTTAKSLLAEKRAKIDKTFPETINGWLEVWISDGAKGFLVSRRQALAGQWQAPCPAKDIYFLAK